MTNLDNVNKRFGGKLVKISEKWIDWTGDFIKGLENRIKRDEEKIKGLKKLLDPAKQDRKRPILMDLSMDFFYFQDLLKKHGYRIIENPNEKTKDLIEKDGHRKMVSSEKDK